MGSSSHSSQASTQSQTSYNEQVGLSDIEGIGIGEAGGNVTISTQVVDGGLIDAALDLGRGAFNTAGDIAADSFSLAGDAVGAVERTGQNVIDFAGDTIRSSQDFAGGVLNESLAANAELNRRSLDSVTGLVDKVLSSTQQTLGGTVGALQAISRENQTSTDERVQKLATVVVIGTLAAALAPKLIESFK